MNTSRRKLSSNTASNLIQVELDPFVRRIPYLPYRRHRAVNHRSAQRCLHQKILQEVGGPSTTYTSRIGGELEGIGILKILDWDSRFFGQQMGAVELYIADNNRNEVAQTLLKKILDAPLQLDHLTLNLDAEDSSLRMIAEDSGFKIMDTVCTYEHIPRRVEFGEQIEGRFLYRRYEPEDKQSVLAIAEKCFSDFKGRFYNDPTIGPDKSKLLYLEWAEKCCSGEMAENLLLAEYRGRVVAFLGWRLHNDLLNYASIRLHGAGLGGVLPVRYPAYKGLLRRAVESLDGEPADFDTHLFNVASINAYQELGLQFVGARHSLHFWR